MGSLDTTAWTPKGGANELLKAGFGDLNTSNDKVVIQSASETGAPSFILKSKGYFDLQSYVLTGMRFPTSKDAFEKKMPKEAFKKLTNLDPTIYERTRDCMSNIGSTCYDYHQNHLSKLVTAGHTAIAYSDYAVKMLSEAKGINLRYQINILTDNQYADNSENSIRVLGVAGKAARMTLRMLQSDADKKKEEVDKIKETMITFKEKTMAFLEDVKYLTQKYTGKPLDTGETPYFEFLNKELEKHEKEFWDTLNKYNGVFDQWKDATYTAIGSLFIPGVGMILMAVNANKAAKLNTAWHKLLEQIEEIKKQKLEETTLILFVRELINQFDLIDDKMENAILAMTELSGLFAAQSKCYNDISLGLQGMDFSIDMEDWENRKAFIDYNLEETINKLKDLKKVATEFSTSVIFKETEDIINSFLPEGQHVHVEELWKKLSEDDKNKANEFLKDKDVDVKVDEILDHVKLEDVQKAKEVAEKVHNIGRFLGW